MPFKAFPEQHRPMPMPLKDPQLGPKDTSDFEYLKECAEIIGSHKIEIDEEKILDLLQIKLRFPEGSIEVINHCGMVSNNFFNSKRFLIYEQWKRLYDLGFTSLISDVFDLTSQLRDLNQRLFEIKGSDTVANFYLSKGTDSRRPTFDPHNHDYDVIVKPLYGSCTWVVNGDKYEANPESVIVIPAFAEHSVSSNPEKRLSLTVNLTA